MPDGAPGASDDGAQEVITDASPSSSHAVVGEGQTRNSPLGSRLGRHCLCWVVLLSDLLFHEKRIKRFPPCTPSGSKDHV